MALGVFGEVEVLPGAVVDFRPRTGTTAAEIRVSLEAARVLSYVFGSPAWGNIRARDLEALCDRWKASLEDKVGTLGEASPFGASPSVLIDRLQSFRRSYSVGGLVLPAPGAQASEARVYVFMLERSLPEGRNLPQAFRAWHLNRSEQAVVRLLVTDKTNKEIAAGLGLSINTVKVYMRLLMRKVGVKTRAGILPVLLSKPPGQTGHA